MHDIRSISRPVSLCPPLLLIPWPHLTLQLEQASYYSPDTCIATCPHVSAEAGPSQHERVSSHLSVKFVSISKRSSNISFPDNVSDFA